MGEKFIAIVYQKIMHLKNKINLKDVTDKFKESTKPKNPVKNEENTDFWKRNEASYKKTKSY